MLGDTAIVVNPNDERYKDVIGKTVILPIVGRELPILADEYVDIDFGSGAMKVTPAHDLMILKLVKDIKKILSLWMKMVK